MSFPSFPPTPEQPDRRRRSLEVIGPNKGIYPSVPDLRIPDEGLADCLNVRIRNGLITNVNVGYELLLPTDLGNQVLLIDRIVLSSGASITVFGTKEDLFLYNPAGVGSATYLNPLYSTGTVTVTAASAVVTGVGTSWLTEAKVGDYFFFGVSDHRQLDAAAWVRIASVDSDTQITLEDPSTTTLGGFPYTIRKIFTADDADWWDTEVFPSAPIGPVSGLPAGDHWYATNGSELVVWDGSANEVFVLSTSTTGLGFSCKTLVFYKNMMLYGNLVESGDAKPMNFKNTAISDPENVTTLEANEFSMAEGVDFLVKLKRLGDFVVGYCDYSVNVAQFVGVPFFFAIRTAVAGRGIYSARSIIDFGNFHQFLSSDRGYRFDGVRLILHADHVFPEVLRQADQDRSTKALALISEEELEVYWIVPLASDPAGDNAAPQIAWTEHYAENVGRSPTPFTKRQIPATAGGFFRESPIGRFSDFVGKTFQDLNFKFNDRFFTSSFPVVLFGGEDGYVYVLNTISSLGGLPAMNSYIEGPTRPLADGSSKGIIRRVTPHAELGPPSVQFGVSVQTQERIEGERTTYTKALQLDQTGNRFVSFRAPGRFGRVRFFTTVSGQTWTISGYAVTVEDIGER